jgi:hypothetical protein
MTLEQRAQRVRKDLFSRYDQLNALWTKAEEDLTRVHIPRPVEFIYGHYPADEHRTNESQVYECLGLQKVKSSWRICHGSYCDAQSGPETWTPIVECSAQIRVEGAKHLPGLRKKAVESAEQFVPKVDEAINALTEALGDRAPDLAELLRERAKLNGDTNKA